MFNKEIWIWKYIVLDKEGNIIENEIETALSATKICMHLEIKGYEIMSLKRISLVSQTEYNEHKPYLFSFACA